MPAMWLVGSEDVQNAAASMRQAAREMQHAADGFRSTLEAHQRWADQWLAEFRDVVTSAMKAAAPPSAP